MKKVFLILAMQVLLLSLKAQNLVPNPSFEQISSCPSSLSEIQFATGWKGIESPDLFSTCASYSTGCSVPKNYFGFEYPKEGFNYAGIGSETCCNSTYREWMETKLIDTLLPGTNYCVSFYVSLTDSSGLAISNIGALFSDSLITNLIWSSSGPPWQDSIIDYPPNIENPLGNIITDTMHWTLIEGIYSPNSKKPYMLLGNFYPINQVDTIRMTYISQSGVEWGAAYYYIDMVSVTLLKPVLARNDTSIVSCDSIVLGANYDDNATYTWWPKTGMNDSTLANPTAQPSVTTTYYVKKVQCSSTTYDSIKIVVGACNAGIKQYAGSNAPVKIWPNPTTDMLHVECLGLNGTAKISICDVLGNTVNIPLAPFKGGMATLDVSSLQSGVYFIKTTQGTSKFIKE